jgi:hypothetical protein
MDTHGIKRSSGRRLLVVAALAAAAMLALAGSATAGHYSDVAGDSGAAPDITGAIVVNAGGQLTFTLQIPTLFLTAPAQVQLFIDSDANSATGAVDFAGADYVLVSYQSDHTWAFAHWTGSDWDWDTPWSTVKVVSLPVAVAFSVNRSELSNTTQVNAWARTVVAQGGAGNVDVAPDVGLWNYDLRADGPDIRGVVTTAKPASGPKAGRSFTVAVTGVKLPPDGETTPTTPQPDKVRCAAKLAGGTLKGRGAGGCTFNVPKNARGKRLVVAVTVEYGGATKTVQLPFRVG